ncbi:alkaline phosphatase [Halyomorpha halys]|uniref:alkaline phosphatase n=1 Tax=Halyomorpha halys TaxID=286706 RepID=UPI0006D5071E|nr:alkaline phosphatase-like [Halyomorpha halys]
MSIIFFFLFILFQSSLELRVLDNKYWKESALVDLYESLEVGYNTNVAKNVIIFIGDGMGPNTVTAARIYSEGETGYLAWEKFPHLGAIKTYAANKQVPDSANTATALYTGIKVNRGTLGVDPRVQRYDCEGSLLEDNHLKTVATHAQEAGKSTGVITTTRATHATPAAMYAHSADRDWECDSKIPAGYACKDIGRQLVEDLPGRKFNIIMGGGRQMLMANSPDLPNDPVSNKTCVRADGRNLLAEWAEAKESEGASYAMPQNTRDLLNIDVSQTDYILGIFHNHYLPHEYVRDKSETGVPSLEEMTITAIKVLMKNKNGFVLMVEGGLIDVAHHAGKARVALEEVIAFNNAINSTMKLLRNAGIEEETLVIVTSDHSHTLTISGYPDIGNNILGIADKSKVDGMPYTTLGYANSVKENYHYTAVEGTVVREDPSTVDTTSWDYGFQAAVLTDENTHGGNDVFIYASGPFAHLFHRIHEQNYVATVMRYASRIGEFAALPPQSTSSSSNIMSSLILLIAAQFIYLL